MDIDQDRLNGLIAAPTEALNIEIKRWLDSDDPEGIAKLVKAALAIRNRNGGFFLIGFDDKTLRPQDSGRPADVRLAFHLDKIQALISKYASEPFEIGVGFGMRDAREYPIIAVPEGVRFPVAAKRDLKTGSGKYLIREGDVYFRTLDANGTPSTAKARPRDWQEISEICFENREADIGRFLRRHLSGTNNDRLIEMLANLRPTAAQPTLCERAKALLDEGAQRLDRAIAAHKLTTEQTSVLQRGAWSVALVIDPPRAGAIPDRNFLNTFESANPNYTGWPIWLDSRGFQDQSAAPKVVERAWQALIVSLGDTWSRHVDFMRLDPKGEFYLWRLLPDDLTEKAAPGELLDVILVIIRVAEAIAVGLSAAKALGWPPEARLCFGFRWTGLHERELGSWANPMASIRPWHKAEDPTVETCIELPLDTAESAIPPFVEQATRDLFIAFAGYTLPSTAVEHWVKRLLERRL